LFFLRATSCPSWSKSCTGYCTERERRATLRGRNRNGSLGLAAHKSPSTRPGFVAKIDPAASNAACRLYPANREGHWRASWVSLRLLYRAITSLSLLSAISSLYTNL